MYRRIYSTEALVINGLRSPSNEFDGTFDQLISSALLCITDCFAAFAMTSLFFVFEI